VAYFDCRIHEREGNKLRVLGSYDVSCPVSSYSYILLLTKRGKL
jgi:hypothetical protein